MIILSPDYILLILFFYLLLSGICKTFSHWSSELTCLTDGKGSKNVYGIELTSLRNEIDLTSSALQSSQKSPQEHGF
jgi:hypothetical protein